MENLMPKTVKFKKQLNKLIALNLLKRKTS